MSVKPESLFSDYGELYLLLEVDPQVLHEAIKDCSVDQLEHIMLIVEDQFNELEIHGPSDLSTASQFLQVWTLALREWEGRVNNNTSEQIYISLSLKSLVSDQLDSTNNISEMRLKESFKKNQLHQHFES